MPPCLSPVIDPPAGLPPSRGSQPEPAQSSKPDRPAPMPAGAAPPSGPPRLIKLSIPDNAPTSARHAEPPPLASRSKTAPSPTLKRPLDPANLPLFPDLRFHNPVRENYTGGIALSQSSAPVHREPRPALDRSRLAFPASGQAPVSLRPLAKSKEHCTTAPGGERGRTWEARQGK